MKILILSLLLVGCGASAKRTTIFYKTSESTPTTLSGDKCLQSGLIVDEKRKIMTEYFSNCDVRITRELRDYELKQWLIKD